MAKSRLQITSQRSTPGLVADALREAILRGELTGGQALRQDDLGSQFGLSATPVREALRQLEAEGLVVYTPNRGAFVSRLSSEEIDEVYEIRSVLEVLALRFALPHITPSDLEQAKRVIYEADQADPARKAALNWAFHAAIYTPSQRPRLLALIRGLHNTTDRYSRLSLTLGRFQERSQEGHQQIIDAIEAGNSEGAVSALSEHIAQARQFVVQYLKQHLALEKH
jgi:DNA-binding GntR family transcriptional regulator